METPWGIILVVSETILALTILSKLKKKEEDYKKLQQSELRLRKEIQVKSKILTIISHDITPVLLYIANSARRLKEESQQWDHTLKDELENISYTTDELISNIKVFLIWNEFQQPTFEMSPSYQSVFVLVENVIRVYKGEAKKKGLWIYNRTDRELLIKVDPVLLRIVLSNLVSNALRHTDAGSINISSSVEDSRIVISVGDSGQGMTEMQVKALYNTLQNNEPSRELRDPYRLKGLGYQIIAEMIRMASGEIRIRSSPGSGTTISVSFEGESEVINP